MRALIVLVLLAAGIGGMSLIATADKYQPVVFIEAALGYQGAGSDAPLGNAVTGSGFVIDPHATLASAEGASAECRKQVPPGLYVITNEHVVRSAYEVDVTVRNAAQADSHPASIPARVISVDPASDLALLLLDEQELVARGVAVSDVDHLRLFRGLPGDLDEGSPVQAIGSPLGLRRSVTKGVISNPEQRIDGFAFRIIQTDAAINPGNSGGPLLSEKTGDVVGVNAAGYDADNVSFAVPAERVRVFVRQSLCEGGPSHTTLPIVTQDVDERIRHILGLVDQRGEVVVRRIVSLGVESFPLQEMDVLFRISGRSSNGQDFSYDLGAGNYPLSEVLFDLEADTTVRFEIWRGGHPQEAEVRVRALDLGIMDDEHHLEFLGAFFEEISDEARMSHNFGGVGALMGARIDGTPADEAGFWELDVLQQVLVRDDGVLSTYAVGSLEELRRVGPKVEALRERALEEGRELTIGFKVYSLDERASDYHYLRSFGEPGPGSS
jgi:serine protease Do